MPLPININALLEQKIVENTRIEYKKDWNPEPILHTICAFANDIDNLGGGYIIIGIAEVNGMPVFPVNGIDHNSLDRINKELLQKCNLIEPRYLPVVEPYTYEHKDILVIWIPGGENRPYKCPVSFSGQKNEKVYYLRKMSNTIKANPSEIKELYSLSETIPFDDRLSLNAQLGDLKPSLIAEYLHNVSSELYEHCLDRPLLDVANDLRIVGKVSELRKPVNVGLMLFNDQPENFFQYARIEIIDKPDPTGTGMTEKIFSGPLDRQLKDALNYLKNYLIKEKVIKVPGKAEAKRIYNLPYAALEEALSNAVYHKSYQISEPITVTITPQTVEITSLPGPDKTISDEDLSNRHLVSRRYRNRRLGDFLKELHLIEGRNTGIPTMLKALSLNGSEPPKFITDPERTFFTVVFKIHHIFISPLPENKPETINKRRNKSEIKALMLKTLKAEGMMSQKELSHTMGYQKPTQAIIDSTRELIREDAIEYCDPNKLHSRNQKLKLK